MTWQKFHKYKRIKQCTTCPLTDDGGIPKCVANESLAILIRLLRGDSHHVFIVGDLESAFEFGVILFIRSGRYDEEESQEAEEECCETHCFSENGSCSCCLIVYNKKLFNSCAFFHLNRGRCQIFSQEKFLYRVNELLT